MFALNIRIYSLWTSCRNIPYSQQVSWRCAFPFPKLCDIIYSRFSIRSHGTLWLFSQMNRIRSVRVVILVGESTNTNKRIVGELNWEQTSNKHMVKFVWQWRSQGSRCQKHLIPRTYIYFGQTSGLYLSSLFLSIFYAPNVTNLGFWNIWLILYHDKDIMCMTSTQWLVGIYNDAANKSWSKYTTLTK